MNPINKLGKFVECIEVGRNKKLPLYTQREIQDMHDTIRTGRAFETINQDAADVAKISGLYVRPHGIGWRISTL